MANVRQIVILELKDQLICVDITEGVYSDKVVHLNRLSLGQVSLGSLYNYANGDLHVLIMFSWS